MPTMTMYRSWKFRITRGEDDRWADTESAYPNQGLFWPETLTVYIEPGLERPSAATFIIRGHWLNSRGQRLGARAFLSSRETHRSPPPWAQPYIRVCIERAQLDWDHMKNGASLSESWAAHTGEETSEDKD